MNEQYIPAEHTQSVEQYARSKAHEAIDVLVDVMSDDAAKGSERVAAANALLDRGHGKPTQAVISVPARIAHRAALAAMSTTELLAAIGEMRLKSRGRGIPADPAIGDGPSVRDCVAPYDAREPSASSNLQSAKRPALTFESLPQKAINKLTHPDFKEGPPALKWEFDEEPLTDPLCL